MKTGICATCKKEFDITHSGHFRYCSEECRFKRRMEAFRDKYAERRIKSLEREIADHEGKIVVLKNMIKNIKDEFSAHNDKLQTGDRTGAKAKRRANRS